MSFRSEVFFFPDRIAILVRAVFEKKNSLDRNDISVIIFFVKTKKKNNQVGLIKFFFIFLFMVSEKNSDMGAFNFLTLGHFILYILGAHECVQIKMQWNRTSINFETE